MPLGGEANDCWLQETQAVALASETSAFKNLLAELSEHRREGNKYFYRGITFSLSAQGGSPYLITRKLYVVACDTKNINILNTENEKLMQCLKD